MVKSLFINKINIVDFILSHKLYVVIVSVIFLAYRVEFTKIFFLSL